MSCTLLATRSAWRASRLTGVPSAPGLCRTAPHCSRCVGCRLRALGSHWQLSGGSDQPTSMWGCTQL